MQYLRAKDRLITALFIQLPSMAIMLIHACICVLINIAILFQKGGEAERGERMEIKVGERKDGLLFFLRQPVCPMLPAIHCLLRLLYCILKG